jgi:hypothetical protein
MNETSQSPAPRPGGSGAVTALRRYGPAAAIGIVGVVVAALLLWPSGDGDDDAGGGSTSGVTDTTGAIGATDTTVDGSASTEASNGAATTEPDTASPTTAPLDTSAPLFFSEAEELGIVDTIDWTSRCDTEVGRYAYPSPYAMPCIAPFTGDNGGATAKGVTADSIKVVVYQAQDDDAIIDYIAGAVQSDDTNVERQDTIEKMSEMFASFAEMYGRTVEFEFFTATGLSNDQVVARADAAAIAEREPFAVWGSPAFAGLPFAEELAAREVMCLCAGGGDIDFVTANSPYLVTLVPSTAQGREHLVEFVGKRLGGQKAVHSGDFVDVDRKMAFVYLETNDLSAEGAADLRDRLADEYGVDLVDLVPYTIDPATLQEQAATIIARLASQDVTTVLFSGDPIAPVSLTQEATAQSYFPEWVVTGTGYTETTAFARLYDQQQWQHAFGISWYSTPVELDKAGAYRRYLWFHGEEPVARDSVNDLEGTISFLYYFAQAAGPDLSPQSFIDAMFTIPSAETASLTSLRLSWGEKGIWPASLEPDYFGVDDQTELWWDPTATGVDEIGREGTGRWRYVEGGRRYYPGERPDGPAPFFDPEGAVDMYTELPAAEALPDYPRP